MHGELFMNQNACIFLMPMASYQEAIWIFLSSPIDDIHNPNDKDSNISQLEFCIQYLTWGVDRSRKEYWDNNDSANYKIDVVTNETRTGPTTDVNDNYEMKHSLFRNPFH